MKEMFDRPTASSPKVRVALPTEVVAGLHVQLGPHVHVVLVRTLVMASMFQAIHPIPDSTITNFMFGYFISTPEEQRYVTTSIPSTSAPYHVVDDCAAGPPFNARVPTAADVEVRRNPHLLNCRAREGSYSGRL